MSAQEQVALRAEVTFTLLGSATTVSENADHWFSGDEGVDDYADLVAQTCADNYPSVAGLIADLGLWECDVLVQVCRDGKWSRKVIAYSDGGVSVRDH